MEDAGSPLEAMVLAPFEKKPDKDVLPLPVTLPFPRQLQLMFLDERGRGVSHTLCSMVCTLAVLWPLEHRKDGA